MAGKKGVVKRHSCKYHCRRCGGHFTSLKAFDMHLVGVPGSRVCVAGEDVGLVEVPDAVCEIAGAEPLRSITLYERPDARTYSENWLARKAGA